jgi:hypothetical protein
MAKKSGMPFSFGKAPMKGGVKKMTPAQFEKSGKDNDKGVKEGSKADIDRDIAEGLSTKKPMKKSKGKK